MLAISLFILVVAIWKLMAPTAPEAAPMGSIGALALSVNLGAVTLLLRRRSGYANLRSVWLLLAQRRVG